MSMFERMKLKFGKDMPISSSIFTGKEGLTAKQHEAYKRGPGHKRAPDETNIFKELNQMQNSLYSDNEEEEVKYTAAIEPLDMGKRR